MCSVLNISTSSSYAWWQRPPTAGAPRIHPGLARVDELPMGRKPVARLIRAEGVQGVNRRNAPHTNRTRPKACPAADLVQPDVSAGASNCLWVADTICIATWIGRLYLAVVIHAWSRNVVGWAMSSQLQTALGMDAFQTAALLADAAWRSNSLTQKVSSTPAPANDARMRGRCQGTPIKAANTLPWLLASAVGDCFDNALCESFLDPWSASCSITAPSTTNQGQAK
jgi:putative transposase